MCKATKRLFTNTPNSFYYNYKTEVYREIEESAECDIHLLWKPWKSHTKKKHSICKELARSRFVNSLFVALLLR
jgi:hypothetical protein